MKQDGENRVGLIRSETAFKVSQKMAEAAAARPSIVGGALNEIARLDPEIMDTVLEVMEVDNLLVSGATIDILPASENIMVELSSRSKPGFGAEVS
jgi:hypothetical protein